MEDDFFNDDDGDCDDDDDAFLDDMVCIMVRYLLAKNEMRDCRKVST